MRFSQRIGIKPATKLAQREGMDDELRASLWSLLTAFYWEAARDSSDEPLKEGSLTRFTTLSDLVVRLWFHHFKKPTDTIERYWGNCLRKLREHFFSSEWHEVYDFIEFVALNGPEDTRDEFIRLCNQCLETENSAYRFVGKTLSEITSAEEVAA